MASQSIGSLWGDIILSTVIVCAIVHLCFGFITIRNLVVRDLRALFIPLGYLVVGAIFSFFSMSLLALSIALVHYSLDSELNDVERAVYVAVLSFLCIYSSCGYTANLYSL
jgi:hypothetical protein